MRKTSLRGVFLVCGWLLFVAPGWGQVRTEAEAIPGQPFGVGQVTIPLTPGEAGTAWNTAGLAISERDGRVLYPILTPGRFRKLIGQLLGGGDEGPPDSVQALFLFTGDRPLEVTVHAPAASTFVVTPQAARNDRVYQRLLLRWWREYNAAARDQIQEGDYPPLVQTYLTSMLSRRLNLTPPLLSRISEAPPAEPLKTLELLMGIESLRIATLRRTNLRTEAKAEAADQPVPAAIPWEPLAAPAADPQVDIEPLAKRVPQEWFYIRFGQFENYLWFNRLQEDFGDFSRMITLRGFDPQLTRRMQQQLALQLNALAEIFGPTIVADIALIGSDLYLREGAALGVLFQARNALLGVDLNRQRAAAQEAEKERGGKLETVTIAGREVSLLSTPDNRVRSFYVADGDYHLVTSSQALVQRFLELHPETESLGASAEFRHARSVMPTSREDTIFVYFSAAFFQNLISPQYQIELARRLRAATDLELLQLATWAGRVEGLPAASVADLMRGGLLPAGFDRRADGSGPVLVDGQLHDSLRGGRGSFAPIPDVPVRAVTPSEAAEFAAKADYYGTNWKQMDPLLVGVKRFALQEPNRERLVIEAHVAPFAEDKYGWLMSLLGPPTKVRVKPAAGDVVHVQASVKGGLLSPQVPPHHLFVGVQDNVPLADLQPTGLLQTLRLLQATPGYLGAWPKAGFLDLLPFNLGGTQADAAGYSQLPLGVWRRQWQEFSVLSFDPKLLAQVSAELQTEEVEHEAQIRIHVGDLSQAKLQEWVNAATYARAYQASRGNVRLLHTLAQQLGVPRDQALTAAETLLDAKLVCPLGGTYRLEQTPATVPLWTSTHWPAADGGRPAEYRAPVLEWFRGLESELIKDAERVVLHTQVDMQRKPAEKKVELPVFDFTFGWFGDQKKQEEPKDAAPQEAPPAKPPRKVPPPPLPDNQPGGQ